jgi:hypothetical protein
VNQPWWVWTPCIAALSFYALFVLSYATRSPWYSSTVGRSLMLSKTSIVLLLSHLLIALVRPYEARFITWSVLFTLLATAGAWQLAMLLRLQNQISNGDVPNRRLTDHKETLT